MSASPIPSSMIARARQAFAAMAREPLVHFLVAGFVLFAAGYAYQRDRDIHRIVITPERVAQLSESYRLQYGQNPGPQLREALVQSDIDNEMLYREGIALKLDQGDEIVRRRIIQKMQFLSNDVTLPPEPDEAQIADYYRKHADRYAQGPRADFTHVFFSSDMGGGPAAFARARRALSGLTNRPRAPDLGDPFPDLYDFAQFGPEQVTRLFGNTAFSKAVFTTPTGQWAGPFQSGYGWHLLRVSARTLRTVVPFDKVHDQVRTDLLDYAQRQANLATTDARRRRFVIVRSDIAR